jgi:hypothetical protein
MKITTEEDLYHATSKVNSYITFVFRREFYNVLAIINIKNKAIKNIKKLMKVINK